MTQPRTAWAGCYMRSPQGNRWLIVPTHAELIQYCVYPDSVHRISIPFSSKSP